MWLEIPVDLDTEASNVHLLRELDRWIALGLLSEGQAINLGRKLCSPLPIAYSAPPPQDEPSQVDAVATETVFEISVDRPFFSRFKSRLVQSFLTEMSVLWLLFLGVFLVVVSSGVLAASQWQSFSTVGQYAILLVYTLVFGGASRWAAGQAKLQTTAQMLKAATLLLIPLNMWMMDALGLFNASVGLAMLASVGLSLLTLMLAPQRRAGLNLLGLSWLHWGWGLTAWPLVASYLGTLGSATNLLQRVSGDSGDSTDTTEENQSGPGGILVAIALLILLVRSVWVAQVPIYQLGLACGVCGWMLCRLRYQAGAGLMLLGWLVSLGQQPLQAMGVSGLAGWLLVERLQRQTQERDQLRTLSTLWLVGLQTCGLAWLALPIDLRQTLLIAAQKFSVEPVSALNIAGVWLYGYVGLMALGVRQFRHQGNDAWAQQTERLALGLSSALLLCALPQAESFLFTLSMLGLTLTFGAFTRLRPPATSWLIYGTHSAAIATFLSGLYVISMRVSGWGDPQWAGVFIGLTAVEWIASVATNHYPEWRRSAWYLGIGLSVMAYSLLLNDWGSWLNLSWLVVPGLLTWIVHRRQFATEHPQLATTLTVLALGGQILLLSSWQMATAACAVGAGLLLLHSCRWPTQKYLPALTVGFALGGGHAAASWLWLMASPWPYNLARLFLVIALFTSGLSILARALDQRSRPLLQTYGTASYAWSRGLAVVLSLGLTLMVLLSLGPGDRIVMARPISLGIDILLRYGIAAITLVLARFWAQRQLTNADYWELAHGVALWVTMGISLWHPETTPQTLGAAMVALGLIAQLMGTAKAQKHHTYKTSWHYIPLVYGALGLLLGHLNFTATTGFYSAVVGIVTLAIGQRRPALRPVGYGGLGLLSLGIYELVLYHLLQASGGALGDGLTILALVGSAIAALYLLCHTWIQRYSQLTEAEIMITSLLHWLLAVALAAMAMVSGQSLVGIWLGVAGLLSLYAWLKGNCRWFPAHKLDSEGEYVPSDHHSYKQWTWSGLVIATVAIPYGAGQLLPDLTFVRSWGGLLACGLSLLIYRLPWRQWGWPVRPWQRMALGWPILAILLGMAMAKTQSLLLVGAFYAAMAKQLRAVRLSYLSLGLLNWSLLRYLLDHGWLTPLWLGTLLGLSALYILEVDPHWQERSTRQERHRLRSFATLLVGLTAIFQAETASLVFIGLSLLISFGFIGLGLGQRVRAYLYTGTLTFALQILRTLMIFVDTDGRLLWAVGIVLGIALIWVAATFESRRAQVSGLLNQWAEILRSWD